MRDDDDTLPWLEPADSVDDDDDQPRFPFRGLILACAAIVAIIAILWYVADRMGGNDNEIAATDEVPLIQAPEGPYKEEPDDPGGLDVDTDSLTHSVAVGKDPESQLAVQALPEEPVPVTVPPVRKAEVPPPAAPAATATKRPPTPQPKLPVPEMAPPKAPIEVPKPAPTETEAQPKPRPMPPAGSATVQLGAFNSAASADQVWAKLAAKGAVAGLAKSVQPVEVGGRTLYRLRASGASDAAAVCAKVSAAGEQCAVVR